LHKFSGLLAKHGSFWGQNRGRSGAMLTPNELDLTYGVCYLYATYGKNWSRNATV